MPELDLVFLGNYIRDARKECGLTQQELADQTGLGQDDSRYRKGT